MSGKLVFSEYLYYTIHMTIRYLYIFLVVILVACSESFGQRPAHQDNQVGYRKEFYGGMNIHTQGWGLTGTYCSWNTYKIRNIFEVSLIGMKHQKEYKVYGQSIDESAKGYVYGKLNSFYVLRAIYGRKKVVYEKLRDQGVQISRVLGIGASLGMTKPEYLEIIKKIGLYSSTLSVERYDPELHNQSNIYGRAQWSRGMSELKVHPGVSLKGGLNFEYSNEYERVKAIEVGAILDVYPWKIPIMTSTDNHFLFGTLYVNLLIGKKFI